MCILHVSHRKILVSIGLDVKRDFNPTLNLKPKETKMKVIMNSGHWSSSNMALVLPASIGRANNNQLNFFSTFINLVVTVPSSLSRDGVLLLRTEKIFVLAALVSYRDQSSFVIRNPMFKLHLL